MIEEIRIMLREASDLYSDAVIGLALKMAIVEVETYCNRPIDYELEIIAERIAVIKLNRLGTEGLTGQSYSGVSENYLDGYPADILAVLNRKRKIKVV
jgi:hypothetical protein